MVINMPEYGGRIPVRRRGAEGALLVSSVNRVRPHWLDWWDQRKFL